jgi:hypothetical protein
MTRSGAATGKGPSRLRIDAGIEFLGPPGTLPLKEAPASMG